MMSPVVEDVLDPKTRAEVVELLRCSVDLLLGGEPFPKIEAARRMGAGALVSRWAHLACQAVGGERTEVQMLEAAARLEERSWP